MHEEFSLSKRFCAGPADDEVSTWLRSQPTRARFNYLVAQESVVKNRTSHSGPKVAALVLIHSIDKGLVSWRICRVEELLKRHLTGLREILAGAIVDLSLASDRIHDAVWTKVHMQIYTLLTVWVIFIYGGDGKRISHHLDRPGIGLEVRPGRRRRHPVD